jgi:hypothetical protein
MAPHQRAIGGHVDGEDEMEVCSDVVIHTIINVTPQVLCPVSWALSMWFGVNRHLAGLEQW